MSIDLAHTSSPSVMRTDGEGSRSLSSLLSLLLLSLLLFSLSLLVVVVVVAVVVLLVVLVVGRREGRVHRRTPPRYRLMYPRLALASECFYR